MASHDAFTTPIADDTTRQLDDADPRARFAGSVGLCASVMDQISPEQFGAITPIGMTAAELMEHLVMVLRRVACAGRGDSVQTWPIDAADVARGEWPDAWRAAAHEVQTSWPDEVLDRPTELPWGVFSGTEVLGVYTNEVTVHSWDLAQATGQQPDWDPAVLETSWQAIREQLPMADRTPMWDATKAHLPSDYPWEDPFANAVPVPDDAPLLDRLVAWNGRRP